MSAVKQKVNTTGRISAFFLENRALSTLLLLASVFVGLFGFITLPKQYNPDILVPAFEITVTYPGASTQDVITDITLEMEEVLQSIPGVDDVVSVSVSGGMLMTQVYFEVGEDIEDASTQVQTKLGEYMEYAGGSIQNPVIRRIDPDDVPVLTVAFSHPNLDQNALRLQVEALSQTLKQVDGVGRVSVHGGEPRAIRLVVDPVQLTQYSITTLDVLSAVRHNNLAGYVGDIDDGYTSTEVFVEGEIQSANDVRSIQVAEGLTIADVAEVYDGFDDPDTFVFEERSEDGRQDVVLLAVSKEKGQNISSVVTTALEAIEDAHGNISEGLRYQIVRNEAEVASQAISGLVSNLFISIGIVAAVLFVFLGRRAAFVVATAIPLTLLWTFFVSSFFGQTINRITLFALILSLGLLVDSATVVTDNIARKTKKGQTKEETRTSIVEAVSEIGPGLTMSTMTSVVVFLPTSKVTGMMGAYMGPLSFFVPVALIASLVVALIFIPFISSLLGQQKQKEGDVFKKLSDRYAATLSQLLSSKKRRNTFLKVVGGLLFVAVLIPMVQLVHFRMLPTADKNQFYVYIDAPEDTVSVQTAEVAETLGGILLASDAVDSIQYYIAEAPVVDFNGLFRNSTHRTGEHQATLRVNLIDKNDRRETSSEIVDTLREQSTSSTVLQSALQQGVTLQFIQDPPGPPVQATFVAKVSGSDQGMREALSEHIYSTIQTIDGVVDVKQSQEFSQMEMAYTIDHQKLTELGVSVREVMQTLEAQFSETIVDRYRSTDGEGISYILMESAQRYQDQGTDSSVVYVETANGVVPLGSLVRPVEREKEPMSVRDNGVETLYVTAETQGRSIVYVMLDVMSMLRKDPTYNVEKWSLTGMTVSQGEEVMEIQWGGEWEMTLENFRDLGLAMMVAMVMIFLLLVAQFKQFLTPALIMVTIPLGLIGIMFGFVLLDLGGVFLTATSLIGFIALMGIVVNNAILYLEQFNLEREAGAEIREALIESGRIRLRPILLTSLTTILGSLTIISDPVWSGLAWSIIFGLSLSSLLTLGVFPVLMYTFNKKA